MGRSRALVIAVAAIMIALTAVFTLLVRVPIPATQGYFNFSDVAIFFAAFTFGPWIGLVAGGVGTALADIMGGYAQFAPLSLVAHGLEGLLVGLLARQARGWRLALAWLAGAAAMVGLYFAGEFWVFGIGPEAFAEVPINLFQVAVGGLVGIPLYYAVRRAYPPITRMAEPTSWREE
ncbi:MAG: ECF transporter S component [Chloroflexota bacterium]